jgi:acetyl-CoA carboxylase biotin carboxyl carrier protein
MSESAEQGPGQRDTELSETCLRAVELVRAVGGRLQRVSVKSAQAEIVIEWQAAVPSGIPGSTPPTDGQLQQVEEREPDEGEPPREYIQAPLVGTFYRAPEPHAAPFVEPGDEVEPGRQVAIIEAMKLMNPVEAQAYGRIEDVLVPDGAPVEFEQPLFLIGPGNGHQPGNS